MVAAPKRNRFLDLLSAQLPGFAERRHPEVAVRIIVAGAGGQLGRELVEILSADDVHAFDHRALDIADEASVLSTIGQLRPNWIINAAAFNDVDGAEAAERAAFRANAEGPANLARAAASIDAALIHVSTDYVFDGRKGSAYTEDDVPNPLSVYGRSKYEGERRVLESKARACVLRTAWLYGRHGKNFVKAIRAAAGEGRPLKVVADQVGSPTAVADFAQAIARLMQTPARGLFHVVNAGACSREEFARAIVRGAVQVLPITSAQAGRAAPRPENSSLISARWSALGLRPLRPWQAALDAFLDGET
ncbi:MAG: dTDP-4-dehydrorhamnose reductase [Chloroflexi bacterium]|nr:MAG: dTDP-4-dehydrorhamnose reductase [Chloroflexota bacterium]